MSHRVCPACAQPAIPISGLLVSNVRCPNCGKTIGPHWFFGMAFFVVIFAITFVSTVAVLAQFGIYAAILWFSFPIGAIGYLKARFSPLETKHVKPEP